MSRLTFARSAGAAGPKMTDVRYIYNIDRQTDRLTDRQTEGALNSQGGAHSSMCTCVYTMVEVEKITVAFR